MSTQGLSAEQKSALEAGVLEQLEWIAGNGRRMYEDVDQVDRALSEVANALLTLAANTGRRFVALEERAGRIEAVREMANRSNATWSANVAGRFGQVERRLAALEKAGEPRTDPLKLSLSEVGLMECQNCGDPSPWLDSRGQCRHCGAVAAAPESTVGMEASRSAEGGEATDRPADESRHGSAVEVASQGDDDKRSARESTRGETPSRESGAVRAGVDAKASADAGLSESAEAAPRSSIVGPAAPPSEPSVYLGSAGMLGPAEPAEAAGERVESGVIQFDEDWPGVFFRGDTAAHFGMTLTAMLEKAERGNVPGWLEVAVLKGLAKDLASCDLRLKPKPRRIALRTPVPQRTEREAQRIDLKTDPEVFAEVLADRKKFEIRWDDRSYRHGDTLVLRETKHTGAQMKAGAPLEYTGRECIRAVVGVMHGPLYGLAAGWVIMSIAVPQSDGERAKPFISPDFVESDADAEVERLRTELARKSAEATVFFDDGVAVRATLSTAQARIRELDRESGDVERIEGRELHALWDAANAQYWRMKTAVDGGSVESADYKADTEHLHRAVGKLSGLAAKGGAVVIRGGR